MADIRALLSAERKARQISHPHLAYGKSGHLQCTVCDLNIPTEKLWEPHLRSANHKKNALARDTNVPVNKKRKIEDDEDEAEAEIDGREHGNLVRGGKKSKSVQFKRTPEVFPIERRPSLVDTDADAEIEGPSPNEIKPGEVAASIDTVDGLPASIFLDTEILPSETIAEPFTRPIQLPTEPPLQPRTKPPDPDFVDEDEWAAFERDLAPLTSQAPAPEQTDKYANATISAPAVSTADLAKQTEVESGKSKRRDYEVEAQDEREEEEARMQDEFAVMEEMEEKIKRLREMREKLRGKPQLHDEGAAVDLMPARAEEADKEKVGLDAKTAEVRLSEEESSGDEIDDWFS